MARQSTKVSARKLAKEWLAEQGTCARCGGTEGLRIMWNGEGKCPLRSISYIFMYSADLRAKVLPQCIAGCHTCWRKSRGFNTHGGGKTGVSGCKCELCLEVRRTTTRERQREFAEINRRRREVLRERGLPDSAMVVAGTNRWNLSKTGQEHKLRQRQLRRTEWVGDRTCVDCGGDQSLAAGWKVLPGPLATTGTIWFYSKQRRRELLALCVVRCRKCNRRHYQRARENGIIS